MVTRPRPPSPAPSQPPPGHQAPPIQPDKDTTRERLLLAALRLFSQQGYARTSVRAIAQEAGANVAAIAYHFGDKAALYTATFYEPLGSSQDLIACVGEPGLGLEAALQRYFENHLEPLRHDDLMRQSLRLHMRELLDPTHVWPELIERECRAPHMALLRLLCRHLGVARADDDMHRLAFSIAALVMQVWTQYDALHAVAPRLMRPAAVATWTQRLAGYALAMVRSEAERRRAPPSPAPNSRKPLFHA